MLRDCGRSRCGSAGRAQAPEAGVPMATFELVDLETTPDVDPFADDLVLIDPASTQERHDHLEGRQGLLVVAVAVQEVVHGGGPYLSSLGKRPDGRVPRP